MNGSLEAQGDHINHSIWAFSGSPCASWVEIGLTQGFQTQIAYTWYYAYQDLAGHYKATKFNSTSPNGSNHAYHLVFDGGSEYAFWLDGIRLSTITNMGVGTCVSAGGLEVSGIADPNYHSDTFNLNPLKWQDTSYNYHTGWDQSQYWIDQPCGQYPWTPGYCENAQFPTSSFWADNKP
jgi:hypothetical protein